MLIKMMEVRRGLTGGAVVLNEIYINSSHIVSVTDDIQSNQHLVREAGNIGLIDGTQFSKVVISEGGSTRSIIVVGSSSEVYNKVKERQILRG